MVTIQLDKERHLKLTLKGMLEFQNITGKNLLQGFKMAELSLNEIGALLYACLIHEDKELKYDDVLLMVDLGNLTAATKAVADCMAESMPEAREAVPLAENLPTG